MPDNITIKLDENEGYNAASITWQRDQRTLIIRENQTDFVEFDIEYLNSLRDALNMIATMDSLPPRQRDSTP